MRVRIINIHFLYWLQLKTMATGNPNNFICLICQEKLFDGRELNITLCGHIYHRNCIRLSLHMELRNHKWVCSASSNISPILFAIYFWLGNRHAQFVGKTLFDEIWFQCFSTKHNNKTTTQQFQQLHQHRHQHPSQRSKYKCQLARQLHQLFLEESWIDEQQDRQETSNISITPKDIVLYVQFHLLHHRMTLCYVILVAVVSNEVHENRIKHQSITLDSLKVKTQNCTNKSPIFKNNSSDVSYFIFFFQIQGYSNVPSTFFL